MRWGANLHRYSPNAIPLTDTQDVLLYDFELKFDNPEEVNNCRFKIMQGNRGFEFGEDLSQAKVTKIKKIVHFISKSEADEVDFLVLKKEKVVMQCRLNISEISIEELNVVKKKWEEASNRKGWMRAKAERGSNLSIPQWNRQWR